jgi:hypothetical protein
VNDTDLETLLRRYRPSGPPPELRERAIAVGPAKAGPHVRGGGLRGWSAVAASLLLATTFYWLAAIERERVSAMLGPEIESAFIFEEPLP